MIERLSIKEASRIIKIFDPRSFVRWCQLNDVVVLKDSGAKLRYVIRQEFEMAVDRATLLQVTLSSNKCIDEINARIRFTSEYLSLKEDKRLINKFKSNTMKLGEHGLKALSSLQDAIEGIK